MTITERIDRVLSFVGKRLNRAEGQRIITGKHAEQSIELLRIAVWPKPHDQITTLLQEVLDTRCVVVLQHSGVA
ncbi:MAG: hypothetical protein R3C05_12760 [Pirellulaceae bacterium]